MDYKECVDLISAAEAYDTQPRPGEVDLLDLGPEIGIREYEEEEVSRTIDFVSGIEAGVDGTQEHEEKQMRERGATLYGRLLNAETLGTRTLKRGSSTIAKELESLLSSTGSEFMSHIKDSGEKLVLPTLSLQDQISELEKISIGLDSNAFSPDEMKIIKMEVTGLAKRKKHAPSDEFQKNLAAMRDARLKEVLIKLGS